MVNTKDQKDIQRIIKGVFNKLQNLKYSRFEVSKRLDTNSLKIDASFKLVDEFTWLEIEKDVVKENKYKFILECKDLKIKKGRTYDSKDNIEKFLEDFFNLFVNDFKKEIQKINDNFNEKYKKYLN